MNTDNQDRTLDSKIELPSLNAFRAITFAIKNSFDFKGRARRSEYWWFILFGLVAISSIIWTSNKWTLPSFITLSITILILLPIISVSSRRLHDIGKSGWLQAIFWFMWISALVLVIMMIASFGVGIMVGLNFFTNIFNDIEGRPTLNTNFNQNVQYAVLIGSFIASVITFM
ncbi:MAG: DUF805 domain-containing protein [Dehalococcoidia bacterium]|nr:DUF805 domain-containing protein [Dehalococcoidia bacterium]